HLFRALGGTVAQVRRLADSREGAKGVLEVLEQHPGEPAPQAPLGAAAEAALHQVALASARGPEASAEAFAQLQEMMRALFCVDLATRNRILAGVGQLITDRDPLYVGEFTQLCGSLVEVGCDPARAIDPILARLDRKSTRLYSSH